MPSHPSAPDDNDRTGPSPLYRAMSDSRIHALILTNILVWVVLASFTGSRLLLSAAGFAVAVGSALYVVVAGRTSAPQAPPRSGPRVWPDTGMKTMLDALDEPAFLTDLRGIVRYQNTTATLRYGAARLGDPLSFKLRSPEILNALTRVANGEEVAPVHFSERGPTERFLLARCSTVRLPRHDDGGRPDFLLVRLRDETEAVKLERMRGDFIANASHELRTPLASLTGFIETLLGPARNDETNRERFLKIMLEQAQRMSRLVDDLLSLTRIEMKAHMRPTERVDLADLLSLAADMLAPVARTRRTTIKGIDRTTPAPIVGDRDELIQVFSNLIENAVKYGADGGHIELSLAAETNDRGQSGWMVRVTDDGPGIASEHLPRLTERFYRVDAARSREQKGTGLGLAIVKHIVNRHHGRLQFQSELGKGTTVGVWFEAAPETDDKA